MRTFRRLFAVAAVALAPFGLAAPAWAQANRTYVSGTGDDNNPCSRSLPCRTFSGAFAKTGVAGEINCLDVGSFGNLTITSSITIDCSGLIAGVVNNSTAFTINDGASPTPGTAEVILRGLTIGSSGTSPSSWGVRLLNGGSLILEDVTINNATTGIAFAPSGVAQLQLIGVTITNSPGNGVLVQPSAAGVATVTIANSRVVNSGASGLRLEVSTGGGSSSNVTIIRSELSSNLNGIAVAAAGNSVGAGVNVFNSLISGNTGSGLLTTGPRAQIRIGSSLISGNTNGVTPQDGTIGSYGNNMLAGNGANGAFSGALPPQ